MIPNILQFIYNNSSKEFSCPFLKDFIKKKIEKKIIKKRKKSRKKSSRIEKNTRIMQKNYDKVMSIFSFFLGWELFFPTWKNSNFPNLLITNLLINLRPLIVIVESGKSVRIGGFTKISCACVCVEPLRVCVFLSIGPSDHMSTTTCSPLMTPHSPSTSLATIAMI